jgi:hypothetical protein
VVKDTGGRQSEPLELTAEVGGSHTDPPDSQSTMVPLPTHSANHPFRKNRAKSIC